MKRISLAQWKEIAQTNLAIRPGQTDALQKTKTEPSRVGADNNSTQDFDSDCPARKDEPANFPATELGI
jgi:hypothetical protein